MANDLYQLVVRNAPQSGLSTGQVLAIEQSVLTLGRDPLSDIILDDPEVSRHHAKLILQAEGYEIQDMGSTNGTFVDGQRLGGEPLALKPGQVIMLGTNVTMVYQAIMADVDPMATVVAPAAPATAKTPAVEEIAEEAVPEVELELPGTAPAEAEVAPVDEVEAVAADVAPEEDVEMATMMEDSPFAASFPEITPEPEPIPQLPPEPEPVVEEPAFEPFPVPEPPAATFDDLDERTYIDSAAPVSNLVEEPVSPPLPPPPPDYDEADKKSSNRNIIIIAVVVVLLICCCLAILAGVALSTDVFTSLFGS